jgi:hypothetical protein
MNVQTEFPSFIDEAKKRVDGLLKWRPQIESALNRNDAYLTYNEVCQRVMAGNMHWFSSDKAFVIGEVITLQRGPYFHVTIAGGNFEGIKQIENEQVIPLLQSAGITRVTMLARNGFTRRNMPGWKPTKQQYFVKEI